MSDELEIRKIETVLGIPVALPILDEILESAERGDEGDYEDMPESLVEDNFAQALDAELDAKELISKLLKSLTEQEREILIMRYNEYSYKEIANEYHISLSKAYKLLKQAEAKITDTLADYIAHITINTMRQELEIFERKGGTNE
jgi:RNA polymerase sigma factor (sigma-70 family)